jgi:pimeloyl-ACP methyl ester carboxylesterase
MTTAATESSVRSADGTRIGFTRTGQGPALVLVHGSLSSGAEWREVAELLAGHFTCFVMDRRGRGRSDDGASPYAIEREYEDIAAVLRAAGPGASLLAHSFGAICALGAALRVPPACLVLYEPPLPVGGPVAGAFLADYRQAVAEGRLEDAVAIGLHRFVGLPLSQIGPIAPTPKWQPLLSLAPTWTRELEAIDALGPAIDHYAAIACPTLLLVGTQSAEHPLKDASAALGRVLRNVRVTTLDGQGHMAARSAPLLLTQLVESFVSEALAVTA